MSSDKQSIERADVDLDILIGEVDRRDELGLLLEFIAMDHVSKDHRLDLSSNKRLIFKRRGYPADLCIHLGTPTQINDHRILWKVQFDHIPLEGLQFGFVTGDNDLHLITDVDQILHARNFSEDVLKNRAKYVNFFHDGLPCKERARGRKGCRIPHL